MPPESTVKIIEMEIENGSGRPIPADLRSASPGDALPVVIVSHGFLGYKRWGFFPYLSERLAGSGFHVLTMSFSLCGVDESTGMITRPAEFASNTVSREIADLERVCDFCASPEFPLTADGGFGLLGHSRGGAVSIIVSVSRPGIGSVVTWSALSKLDRYTDRRKADWKSTGKLEFNESRSVSPLWLDYAYYSDIEANRERFDIPMRASEMRIPHMIIHGERDAAVTLQEADGLTRYPRSAEVEKRVIRGCGHAFGVSHPMDRPNTRLESAISHTVDWFRRTLI